jgi:hypothetical protein
MSVECLMTLLPGAPAAAAAAAMAASGGAAGAAAAVAAAAAPAAAGKKLIYLNLKSYQRQPTFISMMAFTYRSKDAMRQSEVG